MHVLYFHQHFSTPQGSAGTRSYEMARRLVEDGHRVSMVCGSYRQGNTGLDSPFTKGMRRGEVAGIEVIELEIAYANHDGPAKRAWLFLRFALRSIGIALTSRPDVLFATTTPLTAALPGIAARWLKGTRFVFEVRDLWPELPREMGAIKNPIVLGAMGVLEKVAYKSAHRLIGLSPGIVEGIVRHAIPRERICMVPNGCDTDLFGAPHSLWRPEGVSPDDFLAVFCGTHGPANGLDAVVDAAAELKARDVKGIKLLLIGDGRDKPKLIRRVQDEGLVNWLAFHDPVPKDRLAGLLGSMDLGLQILDNVPAFYYGTSPNKFFDYLAAGKPVLTNYPGWVADLVTRHGAGIAVPPNDPCAFADALIEMRARDHRKSGAAAAELAQSQFGRDRLGRQWMDFVLGAARSKQAVD